MFTSRRFIVLFNLAGILLCGSLASAGEFQSRDEVDFGMTDNAYLTKDDRKGDSFLHLGSSNTYAQGAHEFALRLGYTGYFTETPNDVFTWQMGDSFKSGKWLYTGALVGTQYPSGSPANTDVSFDNVGLNLRAETERALPKGFDLRYGGGYRLRDYTSFSGGRLDQNPFGDIEVEKRLSPRLVLIGGGEAGLNFSTIADYSWFFYELRGLADYDLGSSWLWSNQMTLGQTYFLSRTVSTPVVLENRRGKQVVGTSVDHEQYVDLSLSSGVLKKQTDRLRWGGEFNYMNRGSLSGYQDYSALVLMAKLIFIF